MIALALIFLNTLLLSIYNSHDALLGVVVFGAAVYPFEFGLPEILLYTLDSDSTRYGILEPFYINTIPPDLVSVSV